MGKTNKLGSRMKEFYEDITRCYLPRRTNLIIRIDGVSFKNYTHGLKKPYDMKLIDDMNQTAKFLCENIQGTKMAFVQSDEISIVITDYDNIETCAWFKNNLQKIVSVSASMAAAKFNSLRPESTKMAFFDARAFTIAQDIEVYNYFRSRQEDCSRNSIQSLARSIFSHKMMENKSTKDLLSMCEEKGTYLEDYEIGCQRGRVVVKEPDENNRMKFKIIEAPILSPEFVISKLPNK